MASTVQEATPSFPENMSPIFEGDDGDDDCVKFGDVVEKALQFPSVNVHLTGIAHRYGAESSTSTSTSAEAPNRSLMDVQEQHGTSCASIVIELADIGEPVTEPTPSRPLRNVYKHVFGSGLSPVLQKQCDKYKIRKGSNVGVGIDRPDVSGVRAQSSRLGPTAGANPAVPPLPLHALTSRHPAGFDQSPRLRTGPHLAHSLASGSQAKPSPRLTAAKAQPTTPRRKIPPASMVSPDTGLSPRPPRPAMAASAAQTPRTPRTLRGQGQTTARPVAGKGPMTPRPGASEAGGKVPMTPRSGPSSAVASPRSENGKPLYVSPRPPSFKLTPRGIDAVRYLVGASSTADIALAPRCQPVTDVDMAQKLDQLVKGSNLTSAASAAQLGARKGLARRNGSAAAAGEAGALDAHPGKPHNANSSGKTADRADDNAPKCHCGCAIM